VPGVGGQDDLAHAAHGRDSGPAVTRAKRLQQGADFPFAAGKVSKIRRKLVRADGEEGGQKFPGCPRRKVKEHGSVAREDGRTIYVPTCRDGPLAGSQHEPAAAQGTA
jgi:hypothetical protein